MSEPTFPPHPHAGFSAVTYMFDQSQGSFLNRDSKGDKSIIAPGDIHWTLAGSGIVHEEVPTKNGEVSLGLQIFVNLPSWQKEMPPTALHLSKSEIPRVTKDGLDVKVVSGSYNNIESPLASIPKIRILDIHLTNDSFEIDIPETENCFIIHYSGNSILKQNDIDVKLSHKSILYFKRENSKIVLQNDTTEVSHFILFSGVPINEPIFSGGPFVMNSEADLHRKFSEYRSGKMGSLEASAN